MALFKKKQKQEVKKNTSISPDIEKLSLYVTIVPRGQSLYLLKLFKYVGANIQFVEHGEGTAQQELREILGLDDNSKDVILSLIAESKVKELASELDSFFSFSKKNRGIGFAIPLTSIIGVKLYQLLIDTRKE